MSALRRVAGRLDLPLVAFVALAVLGGLGQYLKGPAIFDGREYTHYNNFLIFKYSFVHLLEHRDLYAPYPDLVWDLFKYSPTFALLMGPLTRLPDLPGLIAWDLLNALVLYAGIRALPVGRNRARGLMLWFVALELLISIQNSQSNGLVAGLVLLAFAALERRHVALAALCCVLAFYLKIFGAAAVVLALLYPHRGRFALFSGLWGIGLGLLPLLVVPVDGLAALYGSWFDLLRSDVSSSSGLSVMGVLQGWFGIEPPGLVVPAAGGLLLLVALARRQHHGEARYRCLLLASLLLWMVAFNPKAESPTYVIAMSGVAVWYWTGGRTAVDRALLAGAFVLTSLSHTDLVPDLVQALVVEPYDVKALGAIVIWCRVQYDLLTFEAGGAGDRADTGLRAPRGSAPAVSTAAVPGAHRQAYMPRIFVTLPTREMATM